MSSEFNYYYYFKRERDGKEIKIPKFTKKQIEYLKFIVATTPISMFSRSITAMCSKETLMNVFERIEKLEELK